MSHAIELDRFKGVRVPARPEFAPVTLVVDANNGVKCTVLRSLPFVRVDTDGHGELRIGRGIGRLIRS